MYSKKQLIQLIESHNEFQTKSFVGKKPVELVFRDPDDTRETNKDCYVIEINGSRLGLIHMYKPMPNESMEDAERRAVGAIIKDVVSYGLQALNKEVSYFE